MARHSVLLAAVVSAFAIHTTAQAEDKITTNKYPSFHKPYVQFSTGLTPEQQQQLAQRQRFLRHSHRSFQRPSDPMYPYTIQQIMDDIIRADRHAPMQLPSDQTSRNPIQQILDHISRASGQHAPKCWCCQSHQRWCSPPNQQGHGHPENAWSGNRPK